MCENLLTETLWEYVNDDACSRRVEFPSPQKREEVMYDTDDVCQRNPHGNLAWRKVWFMCSRSASEPESEWWVYLVSELMFVLWTALHQKWHTGHVETT